MQWGTQNQQQCEGRTADYNQGNNDGPMQQCNGSTINHHQCKSVT